jgi:hypothetical protein
MPPKLTDEIITAAIEGYESQKTRIDDQIAELRSLLTGGPAKTAATADGTSRKRWKLSAETRRRMKEAQQRRWAKIRGKSEPSKPAKAPAKPKRKISAAGRKAMAEASRKHWAAIKAAKKKAATPAPKKAARKEDRRKMTAAKKAVVKEAAAETPTA